MGTWRRALPLVAWLAALVAGAVLFHAMGRGAMAPPPVTDPGAWGVWAAAREPAVVVAAVLRLVVLALTWYLVGVTTVGIVARLVRLAGLVRLADALTLPMVRRLLQGALGIGLATAMVGASTAPVPRDPPAPSPTVAAEPAADEAAPPDPDGGTPEAAVTLVRADQRTEAQGGAEVDATPISMRLIGQEQATPGLRVAQRERGGPAAGEVGSSRAGAPADEGAAERRRATHRVVAGESLWSISQDALAEALQREPTGTEVHDYWLRTIEHNRDGLADPDNPDLIFPGDEVVLPAPAPETAE